MFDAAKQFIYVHGCKLYHNPPSSPALPIHIRSMTSGWQGLNMRLLANNKYPFIFFFVHFAQSDALEAKANIVADEVMEPLLSSDEEDRVKCVHPCHCYPRNPVSLPLEVAY